MHFSLTILSKISRMEGEGFGMDQTFRNGGDPHTQRVLRSERDGSALERISLETGGLLHKAVTYFSHISLIPSSLLFGVPLPFLFSRFLAVLLAAL